MNTLKIEIEFDAKEFFGKFSGTGATCGYYGSWWHEIVVVSGNKVGHIGYVDCGEIEEDPKTDWEKVIFIAKIEDPEEEEKIFEKVLTMPEMVKAYFDFQNEYPNLSSLEDVVEEDAFLQFAVFGDLVFG